MRVILDADVLIGALDGSDAHHDQARHLFSGWRDGDVERVVSVVNLSEVLVAPASDRRLLRAARAAVAGLSVTIHQPGEAIGVDAAQLRGRHPISIPDAYCLATARLLRGSVVSFDRKIIRAAEMEGIPFSQDGGP